MPGAYFLHVEMPTPDTLRPSKTTIPSPTHSVVQIIPDGTLQLGSTLTKHTRQVLQIIACGDSKLANKVLRSRLQVAVVLHAASALLIFGAAEVSVRRDGIGAFESLQARLGFGLCGRVVGAFAEELVGRDAFLDAELLAGVALGVVCEVSLVLNM
jgi:hypothetical protein